MRFDVLTLFPDLFSSFIKESIPGRAFKNGLIELGLIDIRDFARGPHRVTDDRPYGGGDGMVMKAGPIHRALMSAKKLSNRSKIVLLTPQGERFEQTRAWEFAELDQLILICGRYEGVDERIRANYVDQEISVGDYILTGGELGALIIIDAVSRLIPGVLGGENSTREESFEEGLLEYPHYTRPRVFEGEEVPPILLSGDHENIRVWRRTQALKRTLERRPDLLDSADLKDEDKGILSELKRRKKE